MVFKGKIIIYYCVNIILYAPDRMCHASLASRDNLFAMCARSLFMGSAGFLHAQCLHKMRSWVASLIDKRL
jgi:hypothetical protein